MPRVLEEEIPKADNHIVSVVRVSLVQFSVFILRFYYHVVMLSAPEMFVSTLHYQDFFGALATSELHPWE